MSDFREIDSMTLYEYDLRMKAHRLQEIDWEYKIHLQAWANCTAKQKKMQGRDKIVPVFTSFKQFYDYDRRIEEVLATDKIQAQEERLKRIAKRVREYERGQSDYGEL